LLKGTAIFGALVALSAYLFLRSAPPADNAFEDPPPQEAQMDPDCPTHPGAERKLARLSNEERSAAGRRTFRLDPQLSRVARRHTADMIAAGELEHTPPRQLARRTTNWIELNEDIGKGSTPGSIFRGFMNSAPHRRRILDATYNHVGIGVLKSGSGHMWVTMVFESTSDPGTTLPKPSC
jgi:uncharacterized protein YkwD